MTLCDKMPKQITILKNIILKLNSINSIFYDDLENKDGGKIS